MSRSSSDENAYGILSRFVSDETGMDRALDDFRAMRAGTRTALACGATSHEGMRIIHDN